MDKAQVGNVMRHVGSFAAGAITLASVFAIVNVEEAKELTADLNEIIAGISQASGGILKASIVIGPIIVGLMARWGSHAVSTSNKLQSVAELNDVKIVVGPNAPPVAQRVANDRAIPNVVHER